MLKITLFLLVWLACLSLAFGQTIPNKAIKNDTTIYTVVQRSPAFVGGQMAMAKWIHKSLIFKGLDSLCKGGSLTKVHFSFVIEKDGSLSNKSVKTSMTASPACRQAVEKQLLVILDSMPAWDAGRQDGKPVRVRFSLPMSLGHFWGIEKIMKK